METRIDRSLSLECFGLLSPLLSWNEEEENYSLVSITLPISNLCINPMQVVENLENVVPVVKVDDNENRWMQN